jgi:hypothetical protein
MQKKYKDKSVMIEVIQIIIEIDISGKEKQQQRYGMSYQMANPGKQDTVTCQSERNPIPDL